MPALFYHITQSAPEEVMQSLLPRAVAAGWTVELRGVSAERMAWFDERLWLGAADDFLAHGMATGDARDLLQPILLTDVAGGSSEGAVPLRSALMTVDGAEVLPDEVAPRERVWILFDGRDPSAVERARAQWRGLTDAGVSAQYWSEESGRWEKKAER